MDVQLDLFSGAEKWTGRRYYADRLEQRHMAKTTPDMASLEMQRLVAGLKGDPLHRAVDALMCRIMREHGFGNAVDTFLRVVDGYHGEAT